MIVPRIGSAMRRTVRIACERPRVALWTLIAVTVALFAAGVAALAAAHVERWTRSTDGSSSMVVYLGETVDEPQARALAVELAKLPGVERAELVPPAESASRLQRALGADSALLEGVELATLPASVEVTLAPGMRDVITMSPTLRALEGSPAVEDIVVEHGTSARTVDTLGSVRRIVLCGALMFGVLALFGVLAVLRLHFERGAREVAVAHLLGASPSFLIVPTALAGALVGTVAGLLALGALQLGITLYGEAITNGLAGALGIVEIALPAPNLCALFVALGAGLGLVGGGLGGAARALR
jgi:cell division transport system permease protein